MTSWTRVLAGVITAAIVLPVYAADPAAPAGAAAPSAPAATSTAAKAKKSSKGAATSGDKGAADPKSQGSYSLGLVFGSQVHGSGLTLDALSLERFNQGLKDALTGKVTAEQADVMHLQALLATSRVKWGEANASASKKFLEENGKQPGVVTTASGLQYKVINAGSGNSPQATDQVKVNYRGTLLDGTEFDSSYKRNEPATFGVSQVIKGWTEALLLMKPGAKWQLTIPAELAYGPNGRPGIPPNALLKFDVELLGVEPPAPKPAPGASAAPGQPGGTPH